MEGHHCLTVWGFSFLLTVRGGTSFSIWKSRMEVSVGSHVNANRSAAAMFADPICVFSLSMRLYSQLTAVPLFFPLSPASLL